MSFHNVEEMLNKVPRSNFGNNKHQLSVNCRIPVNGASRDGNAVSILNRSKIVLTNDGGKVSFHTEKQKLHAVVKKSKSARS